MAALFIAKVKSLSSGIAHGIIAPGRETKLVGILAPGIGNTALRDHGAEVRVRQYVYPGRRRYLITAGRYDIFAAVRRESPQAVVEYQVLPRCGCNGGRQGAMRAGGSQGGNRRLGRAPAVHLFRERSPAVADDGPGDRLEEKAVFLGYLVGGPHKDAARSIL